MRFYIIAGLLLLMSLAAIAYVKRDELSFGSSPKTTSGFVVQ